MIWKNDLFNSSLLLPGFHEQFIFTGREAALMAVQLNISSIVQTNNNLMESCQVILHPGYAEKIIMMPNVNLLQDGLKYDSKKPTTSGNTLLKRKNRSLNDSINIFKKRLFRLT